MKSKNRFQTAVNNRGNGITGNRNLTTEQILKIVELLDEVSPKGVLKEFTEELRRGRRR